MRGTVRLAAVVAIVPLALAGCASSPGSEALTGSQLIGRWVPTAPDASAEAFVEFAEDGTLQLSDGCNGAQGEWRVDGGVFAASTGPHTQMFCEGYVPVHSWLDATESIEITDGILLLKGADGSDLGELSKS